ncbi:MAG: GNAT family N-acetyltransferase [Pseudobdellovibrionaceae bacterium]
MNHRCAPNGCPTGSEAATQFSTKLNQKEINGLIAYIDEKPVGWCAIDKTSTQIGHDFVLENPDEFSEKSWMIHCLYIHPEARRQGISKMLIKDAIEMARSNGADEVLAFPIPEKNFSKFPKDLAEFSGRFSTFKFFGFKSERKLNDFYEMVALKFNTER